VLIVTALSLAGGAILGLPLDVANKSTSLECGYGSATTSSSLGCGNLDMTLFWEVVMVSIFVYVVVLLPMAIFQYEAYDEVEVRGKRTTSFQACVSAGYWELLLLVATFLTLGLMYAFLGVAQVPVTAYQMDLALEASDDYDDTSAAAYASVWDAQDVAAVDLSTAAGLAAFTSGGAVAQSSAACVGSGCYVTDPNALLEIRTTFAVYIIALTGWVGWFFFVVFGGIGLASLPASLLRAYTNRPVLMSADQLAATHARLQGRTNELLKLGLELKKSRDEWQLNAKAGAGWRARAARKASDRTHVNKFTQMVFVLEVEYETWRICKGNSKEHNPLAPYVSLLLGLLASLLTLFWLLHIVLYVLVDPPVSLFLNAYFIQFDAWFPLFGVASVCLFAGYLLACVMSGIFKVGLRCFCMTLHPMRYGKTLMNAFLFNTMWILLCAIPVVQFCAEAFDSYARYTSIATLLGVQVKHLKFLRLFFEDNVFVYCLLAMFGLSLVGLGCKPNDKAADAKKLKQAIRAKR
jgi:LMBR1 domain-containing protein 1